MRGFYKMKWGSMLALFGFISGLLSAVLLPMPVAASDSIGDILRVTLLPGLSFGVAIYIFFNIIEKKELPIPRALFWMISATMSSAMASLFTLFASGNNSPLIFHPALIYFLSGTIAGLFVAVGFRVFATLNPRQIVFLVALGGALSIFGVWFVGYLDINTNSKLANFLFFEIWQVGMAFALESVLHNTNRESLRSRTS